MHIGCFGNGNSDVVTLNYNLAARDGMVIGQNPHLFMLGGIKGNHRAASHPQKLLDRQAGAAQKDRYFNLHSTELTHRIS